MKDFQLGYVTLNANIVWEASIAALVEIDERKCKNKKSIIDNAKVMMQPGRIARFFGAKLKDYTDEEVIKWYIDSSLENSWDYYYSVNDVSDREIAINKIEKLARTAIEQNRQEICISADANSMIIRFLHG